MYNFKILEKKIVYEFKKKLFLAEYLPTFYVLFIQSINENCEN